MTDYSRWLVSISSPLAGCSILNIIVSCLLSINRSFLKHFCQYWTIFAMPPGRKVDGKKSKKNIWKTSITWFSQKNVAALERSNRKKKKTKFYIWTLFKMIAMTSLNWWTVTSAWQKRLKRYPEIVHTAVIYCIAVHGTLKSKSLKAVKTLWSRVVSWSDTFYLFYISLLMS